MFTGLIQGQGDVLSTEHSTGQCRLAIRTRFPLPDLSIGESIAVNGICLTVETGTQCGNTAVFTAYASRETMSRTTLKNLLHGDTVNLERALAMGQRLGGHIVSGHVDAVATVRMVEPQGDSRRIVLDFPSSLGPEVIEKGSVALDGISLTVNACTVSSLEVNVIPETWRVTTVARWTAGTLVNMETDILGKYVRRNVLLHAGQPDLCEKCSSGVSMELLRDNGFL